MKKLLVVLSAVVMIACLSGKVFAYQDFPATRIINVYTNVSADGNSGWVLIRISDSNGSPEGLLLLPGSLNSPMSRAMFAVINLAYVTQKTCWMRVETTSGYWTLSIVQLNP